MKRIATTLIVLLTGCDTPEPKAPTGKEEAGQVAIGCLASMSECSDWTPIVMADTRKPMPIPDCEETWYPGCSDDERLAARHNRELLSGSKAMRSPCQQRVDACVSLVQALAVPNVVNITRYK